jgi:hypothetical protein
MSTPVPFPIDPALSGVVIAYANEEFVADRVLPRLDPKLGKRDFKYSKFDFAQTITIPDTRVGRKGTPNEVEFAAKEVTDSVDDYGLDDVIPNDDITNAPANYDPRAHAAMATMDLVLLDREKRVADKVFNRDTYGAAQRVLLSGSSQWSDPTSRPIVAIQDASDAMVMKPNVLVLGRPGWTQLRRNPSIISSISVSGTSNGLATLRAVADLLELDEIVVGSAWGNAARRGQPVSMQRLWGKHAALIRRDKLATTMLEGRPTFGWTAQYGERIAGDLPEPKTGLRGSVRVRAGESVKEVISAPDLGYFFENVAA